MSKLDGKFHGIIAKNKDGSIVPQDEWIVFLAKDNALLPTLNFYIHELGRIGAAKAQINAAADLRDRVFMWRKHNHGKCKVPDAQPGEIVL